MTTSFKDKQMLYTSHNLQALKLKKKLEALPPEKLTDVQKRFLANEANGEIITVHDLPGLKQKAAEEKASIEAAEKKLLDERKVKSDAETKKTEKPAKVTHGKTKAK